MNQLKQRVDRLCNDVLIPMSSADKDIKLPSDIMDFIKHVEFQRVSPTLVTCRFRELCDLKIKLVNQLSQSRLIQVIDADRDKDELTMLSDGINNAVDSLLVSYHCTRYTDFMLMNPV